MIIINFTRYLLFTFTVILLLGNSANATQSKSIEDILGDKKFWSKLDWIKIHSSDLFVKSNWIKTKKTDIDEENNSYSKDSKIYKKLISEYTQYANIKGVKLKTVLRDRSTDNINTTSTTIRLTYHDNETKTRYNTERVIDWYVNKLGNNYIKNITKIDYADDKKVVFENYQWVFNNSVISILTTSYNKIDIISPNDESEIKILIEDIKYTKLIKPDIILSCVLSATNNESLSSNVIYVIADNAYDSKVKDSNYNQVDLKSNTSDCCIDIKDSNNSYHAVISRLTGSLFGTLILSDKSKQSISGKCEKLNNLTPKF